MEYSGGYSVIKSRDLNNYFEGKLANTKDYMMFFKRQGFAGAKLENNAKRKNTYRGGGRTGF